MSRRRPIPPPAVDEWCRRYAGVPSSASGEELVFGATRALEGALSRPVRDREAAFALLAADALLTYACEDAADAPDPERELLGLLGRIPAPGRG